MNPVPCFESTDLFIHFSRLLKLSLLNLFGTVNMFFSFVISLWYCLIFLHLFGRSQFMHFSPDLVEHFYDYYFELFIMSITLLFH